jgi:hypothetical protein
VGGNLWLSSFNEVGRTSMGLPGHKQWDDLAAMSAILAKVPVQREDA